MKIETLTWDSEFFGYKIGKLEIKSNVDCDNKEFMKLSSDYKLVYVFSKEPLKDNIILKLADTKVYFSKKLIFESAISNEMISKPLNLNETNYSELLKLVYESGKYSRFKTDAGFENNEYEKLYKKWIDESITKNIAIEVLVYQEKSGLAGFITIGDNGNKCAQIGLIAVSPDFQGQGIGVKLMRDTELFALRENYNSMIVATQYNNIGAVKLYQKCGYSISSKTYIYHYWNQKFAR